MFLDEARIKVSGGSGGKGAVSYRREKYIAKGGPDGGDGGKGGDVILRAESNTDTLSAFSARKRFAAENGQAGARKNQHGRNGADLVLPVPPGTVVMDGNGTVLSDLSKDGAEAVVARGGRGGYGNAHFKGPTRQKPDFAENGEPGQEQEVDLELKLVADIGIIGLPSVGKSTLIAAVSAARPKIADYPFTTLVPNLGVVHVSDRTLILCDVPGLIEGASEGKGLGDTFLRHIERCGVLLHLLDATHGPAVVNDYRTIRSELEAYSPTLAEKQELVVLNKEDIAGDAVQEAAAALEKEGITIAGAISAATKNGTEAVLKEMLPLVLAYREAQATVSTKDSDELPVLTPHLDAQEKDMHAYSIEEEEDGSLHVSGKRLEQFTAMTDFTSEGAIRRFRDVIGRIGLKNALLRERASAETPIFIGKVRVEGYV